MKYLHKAIICNFYGDILVKPFEFDASKSGFNKLRESIRLEKEKHGMKQVVFGIETTGHYYEDLVHHCYKEGYHVRIVNAATTKEMRNMLSLPELCRICYIILYMVKELNLIFKKE